LISIQIGQYKLEINDELNRSIFSIEENRIQKCGCPDCINFDMACQMISNTVIEFFDTIGIAINKPKELMCCYDEDGKVLYSGYYNLVGKMLEGKDCYKLNWKNEITEVSSIEYEELTEGFKVGFAVGDDWCINGINYPHIVLEFEGWFKRLTHD
jgi:hypothetical protein